MNSPTSGQPSPGERWGLCELVFTSRDGAAARNPFTEVELSVRFQQAARTFKVRGFFDGDSRWKARFMPPEEGEWRWVTHSTCPDMDGLEGRLEVGAPSPGNHGPVRVAHRFHFAHADGTRHLSFGTTCYGWVHQPLERQEQTLHTLSTSPFNKVRMCVFPKYYDFHRDPPLYHAFEQNLDGTLDWSRPHLEHFRLLERRIADLCALGIEADLILFHPYDHYEQCAKGFWGYHNMPAASEDAYLRYLVARVAAYRNVWWSLANEWDFMKSKTLEDWGRFIRVLKEEDHYGHLTGIHNGGKMYDQTTPELTHVSAQRIDTYRSTEDTLSFRDRFWKPVVWDEIAYEGDISHGWGNIGPEELIRRFWEGMIRGGYAGHGETYLHPQEILWWSRGGVLHGHSAPRIAFLRTIAESCPGPGIEPLEGEWDAPAGGCEGRWILRYYGFNRPRWRWFHLPKDGSGFEVSVLDTWNMTRTPVPGIHRDCLKVDLPGRQYMAILARRLEPSP